MEKKKFSKKSAFIFVISGPSGSGKTTLAEKILKARNFKKLLARSISFTTRPKRAGEKEGEDYFFISRETFLRENKAKKVLEWTKYLEYYYGTPKGFVDKQLRAGRHLVMCLDLRGALRIKRIYPKNAVTIFVEPPSLKDLRERIVKRSRETRKTEIARRMALARKELLARNKYDYRIVNDRLGRVVKELKGIILSKIKGEKAYGLRTARESY